MRVEFASKVCLGIRCCGFQNFRAWDFEDRAQGLGFRV